MAFRTLIDGGPVPALSKYALREVTGISFLTRSIFKERERLGRSEFSVLTIKAVLGRVEDFSAGFRDAVLTPELVSLGAVLRVGVGNYVSATAAPEDHDPPHFMMGKILLVD